MFASVRALLSGAIDYAGLFPPAKLPLEQALRNYLGYVRGPERWMLGSFICPAEHLAEMTLLAVELLGASPPIRVAALVKTSDSPIARAELDALQAAHLRYGDRVQIPTVELRLPAAPAQSRATTWLTCTRILADIAQETSFIARAYFEVGAAADWRATLSSLADARKHAHAAQGIDRHAPSLGLKLRCGGLEPTAIPTSEQVAHAIAACRDAALPLKFTAGLHHAVRHLDRAMKRPVHGFLNVFVAGVLAHARGLSEKQLQRVIEDQDAKSFVFDEGGFQWRDFRASTAEIAAARDKAVITFGSCSFDEPREDLRALGLLDGSEQS